MTEFSKYDEYKFFAESTQSFVDRRQNATKNFLAILNGAFLVMLGLLAKDALFEG